jgi:diketogulonate reductase-like aldo/keto reductase
MQSIPKRPFGETGHEVAVIGQGTWKMEKRDRARSIEALRKGLDLGMTHIDTAEMYGSGDTEEIVGEAIRGRRDEVFLVSKVMPQNASRAGTVRACEQSLRRLGVERLDCYLLHWPGRHPLEETFAAFDQLVAAGKIASWGVSNFDEADLQQALSIAGEGRIACNQVLYHLQERAIEHAVLPFCRQHAIAVVGYSPFGQDAFPSPARAGGRELARIAAAHDATPRQVALAFLVREPGTFTIPKSSDSDHVAENARAGAIHLSAADLAALDQAFPIGRRRGLPML